MRNFQKKEDSEFSKEEIVQAFVQETHDSKSLMQKELDVNQAEQVLLHKRIELMKSTLNEIASSDPQYSMLAVQIQMDQIEIDELKFRELILIQKLKK